MIRIYDKILKQPSTQAITLGIKVSKPQKAHEINDIIEQTSEEHA